MANAFHLKPLLATFAGWINRQQAQVIDYLVEENRILKEQLGGKRPRLTDDQRRRLAAKGKPLGRRVLDRVATIVTPDTILRWYRRLIAAHHTYPHNCTRTAPSQLPLDQPTGSNADKRFRCRAATAVLGQMLTGCEDESRDVDETDRIHLRRQLEAAEDATGWLRERLQAMVTLAK